MFIPEKPTPMPAGHYPAHVEAACLVCEVKPESLLAWTVRMDAVSLVLESGAKVTFPIEGKWQGKQLALPWESPEEIHREDAKNAKEEKAREEKPKPAKVKK